MTANLTPPPGDAQQRPEQVKASFDARARAGFQQAGASLGRAWKDFKRQDWFAGIEPLPRETVSAVAAITIVTGLVLTSLLYTDIREQQARQARLIPSGEHPSQHAAVAEPEPAPVPESGTDSASPSPAPAVKLPQQGEAFVEHFRGQELDQRWLVSDGWSNGEFAENDWRRSQVKTGPDGLRLTLAKAPQPAEKPLMGAEIRTSDFYRYGYFEARMRVPRDPGIVTAVFSYAGNDKKRLPNEIDIEILGRDTRTVELTFHESGRPTHAKVKLPFDAAADFHTYGFEWLPDAVRWYADGVMIHEVKGGRAVQLVRPQQFMLSQWATHGLQGWAGEADISRAPWTLEVSCTGYRPAYDGKPICS